MNKIPYDIYIFPYDDYVRRMFKTLSHPSQGPLCSTNKFIGAKV